jgi:hypothetical protein
VLQQVRGGGVQGHEVHRVQNDEALRMLLILACLQLHEQLPVN